MINKQIKEKGFLVKLFEQGLKILLKKECKKISNIKIDIVSSSSQIIKGEIQEINIIAENINYKDLLFDVFKLEANDLKINFKLTNKKISIINNPRIKLQISLSEDSLRTVLLSNKWNWIGNMISEKILSQEKLEDLKIMNNQLSIKASEKNIILNQEEQITIKAHQGKVYFSNKTYNTSIQIPIEDKIYIENLNIENNIINICANSSISF